MTCILPAGNVWTEGGVIIWFIGHDHGSDDRESLRSYVDHVEFSGVVFAVDGMFRAKVDVELCEGVFLAGSWEEEVWGLAVGAFINADPYTVVGDFGFHVSKGACSILKERGSKVRHR